MPTLTPAQHKVACMYATGMTQREIGRRLGRSGTTIKSHVEAVYAAFGVPRRDWPVLLTSLQVRVEKRRGANALGMRVGDPVRIVGGRFAGRAGTYAGRSNGAAWRVDINGAVFLITKKFVEPIKEAA